MGYYRTSEPVGNTCPLIDKVIEFIEGIELNSEVDDISPADIKSTVIILEEIRSANASLRDWGNVNAKEADDFEEQTDELKRKMADLESDLSDKEKYISNLQKQNEELEEKLNEMQE